jgi:tRNA nucleotidyltransferase (CCA-adding enzyme)
MKNRIKELLNKVTEMMKPFPVYLVGGACRDYLMGNFPKDFDFCTPATPEEIEEKIKQTKNEYGDNRKTYGVGKKFGTIGCKIGKEMIEITTFRSEKYEEGNRKPKVEFVKSIHDDLSRRDFTINSIAIRLAEGKLRIIDLFGGQEDIQNKIIRAVKNPKQRFKEDPLRLLRAIRFSCKYDFSIDKKTYEKLVSGAISILNISKERWVMEIDKILLTENVDKGLRLLWESRLFNYMIPELSIQWKYNQNSKYHKFDLATHTINVVKETPKDLNMRWSALLHDVAKPFVRTEKKVITEIQKKENQTKSNYIGHEVLGSDMVERIANHLKWSKERKNIVVSLVKNHLKEDCPLREYDNLGKKFKEE